MISSELRLGSGEFNAEESRAASEKKRPCPLRRGSLLKVILSRPLQWPEWRPGSLIEGRFIRPVYSGGQIVIPSKSRLILEIDHVTTERVKGRQVQGWRAKISNSFRSLARRELSHSVAESR